MKKTIIFALILIQVILLCSAGLTGCAEQSPAIGLEPDASPAASPDAKLPEENGVPSTDTTQFETLPESEPGPAYNTQEGFEAWLSGLTNQAMIDRVETLAASVNVNQSPWDSSWPDVEENPDALAKVSEAGVEAIPYLIRWAYYAKGAASKKGVLLMNCLLDSQHFEGKLTRLSGTSFADPMLDVSCAGMAIKVYLWYMENPELWT